MSVFQILIAVGITFVAVAIGIASRRIAAAWLTFRSQFVVICPEDRTPAGVIVDAMHAAVTAWSGRPKLRLSGCSDWPERGGCRQTCLAQIGTAPQDCLIPNILARWYDGKYCVRCGVPVGEAYWGASKPALLTDGVVEQCEQTPGPQLLPMLETAQPICFACYVEARANRNTATLAAH
jgi:hypothetical protein